jgi:lysophospholipase L1-like esterase
MAIGDSITVGTGSSDGGYPPRLAHDLDGYWGGRAIVLNEGVESKRSNQGESLMWPALMRDTPAYALVLFGTNDFNDHDCRASPFDCFTVDALRSMVQQARDAGAVPVLGTIPPVNSTEANADERNDWVVRMNELIRAMARQERVAVADIHRDFMSQPSLAALFWDEKHPNNEGYRLIALSFCNAITRPRGASISARDRR